MDPNSLRHEGSTDVTRCVTQRPPLCHTTHGVLPASNGVRAREPRGGVATSRGSGYRAAGDHAAGGLMLPHPQLQAAGRGTPPRPASLWVRCRCHGYPSCFRISGRVAVTIRMTDECHVFTSDYLRATAVERQRLQARWTALAVTFDGRYPAERPCVVCGVRFRYPHRGLRVCSQACVLARQAARQRQARWRTARRLHPYQRACVQCGQLFATTRSDATTCSPRCRTARRRARTAEHDRTVAG
jgi:hypothetical protein